MPAQENGNKAQGAIGLFKKLTHVRTPRDERNSNMLTKKNFDCYQPSSPTHLAAARKRNSFFNFSAARLSKLKEGRHLAAVCRHVKTR
jgi:hypothetical protein